MIRTIPLSGMISSTSPSKLMNAPLVTLILSPFLYSVLSARLVVGALGFLEHLGLVLGAHRRRLAVGADEIADAFGLLDHEPDLFGDHAVLVEFELDEDVAGIELAVALLAHAALHGADALGGDEDPADDVSSTPSILTLRGNASRTRSSLLLATRRTKNCIAGL